MRDRRTARGKGAEIGAVGGDGVKTEGWLCGNMLDVIAEADVEA